MKKTYLMMAVALAALASCSDDTFIGDQGQREAMEGGVISFTSSSRNMTRAENTDAANLLNKNFVFLGTKGTDNTKVFDNYQANYVQNTSNTTESNSSGWEYVTYKNLPNGVGTNVGVTAFSTTTTGDPNNSTAIDQTIKYWDYSTTQYDFAAYSLGLGYTPEGEGQTTTYAKSSAINPSTKSYTLTGSAEELKACYISDLVTAYNVNDNTNNVHISDFGAPVQFSFRSLGTKIRLAFYETVPGYSVKDVKFYTSSDNIATTKDDGTNENAPTLFTSTAVIPSGSGTMTISFPTTGYANREATDYNKAHVAFTSTSSADLSSTLPFEALNNFAAAEYKEEAATVYIGRASNEATYAGGATGSPAVGKYYTILPNETGANLMLRIKYTLVSRDGSGEEMTVDNATAVIPAELAKWQPNYAYTYIFKIGDMTNGSTGEDGSGNVITGLTPITLDAVVVNNENGIQETITTVATPSITTYAEGKVVTANNEYKTNIPIYIIVNNGTSNVALTVGTNANLYTATLVRSEDLGDEPAASAVQTISEESVANALANGTKDNETDPTTWTVKDANKWKLVVTKASGLTAVTSIAAEDSPTGNAIIVNGAKFTPTTTYTKLEENADLTQGKKYYTSDKGEGEFEAGENAKAGASTYERTTDGEGYYIFEYDKAAVAAAGAVNYTEETAAAYNATLPGAVTKNDVIYSFTSYAAGTETVYGTGKVKVVQGASTNEGWTVVEVVENTITSFVGNRYKVHATDLTGGGTFDLYNLDGTTTGISVTVAAAVSYTETEAKDHNNGLPGHVTAGQQQTPAVEASPASKHYKVIKVVN